LLLLGDELQNVAGPRDVRQVDLGLNFTGLFRETTALASTGGLRGRFEIRPDLFGLKIFHRAGVRLLLGHANLNQHVEDGFALDFQFPG
jgi:hypothetical protein